MPPTQPDPPRVRAATRDPRRWRALAVLASAQFVLLLDDTIVNVALDTIREELGSSTAGLAWVVNGYLLASAGLLLLGGRLADLLGRRRIFTVGMALFGTASLVCGLAPSEAVLIAGRVGQGVGAALVGPAALALVLGVFTDPAERAKAVGLFGGLAALGGTVGVVLSGLITELIGWRGIFLVNLPIAVAAILLVPRLVDEVPRREARLDLLGALVLTSGLTALVYGLIHSGERGWGEPIATSALVVGALLVVAFAVVERRADDPLVPLQFFRHRARTLAATVLGLYGAAFLGLFFLLTLYMQQVLGYGPVQAGLAYLVFGVGTGIGFALSTTAVPRIGVRPLAVTGLLVVGLGLVWLSQTPVDGLFWRDLAGGMAAVAVGGGAVFSSMQVAGTHGIAAEDDGLSSALLELAPQLGGALGLALVVALAGSVAGAQLDAGVGPAAAQTAGFEVALLVAAAIVAVAAAAAACLGRIRPRPAT